MRISTTMMFDSGAAKISDLESTLATTQQHISSGKRVMTPSDDPVAAAQSISVSQSQGINSQFTTNRAMAKDSLGNEDNVLANVTTLLQNAKTIAVSAGNGILSDAERADMANQLSGQLQDLMGYANSRDAMGNYLFSGYDVTTQPFTSTANGAVYVGDQGQRMLQVGPSSQMSLSDSGDAIFQNIKNGNGTFVTAPASVVSGGVTSYTNQGSGVIGPGSVADYSALTGDSYKILFHVGAGGGATTYDILDTTKSTTVSAGNTYASGQNITFAGMQVSIQGSPADGDSFTVQPSSSQSIFTTFSNLINVLKTSTSSPTGASNLANGLSAGLNGIDNALNNVVSVRASVGARLQELDSLDNLGQNLDLQYSSRLSNLQDLDYAKAITDLNANQTILQAAQKSFMTISGLSLFSLLPG